MNIILLGIQGSGKSTLISDLEGKLDMTVVSAGQLLRDEVATGSELGKHIHELQSAGILVELDIVLETIKKKLKEKTSKYVIFDGFPRTMEQADALDKILKVDLVILLKISEKKALDRLLNRLTCQKCGYVTPRSNVKNLVCPLCSGKLAVRSDDTLEVIERRFKTFKEETMQLVERYKRKGVLVEIDVEQDRKETFNNFMKVINECYY